MLAEPGNTKNIQLKIYALNNTALFYHSLKKTEKAEQLLTEALQLGRELDTPRALLPTLNNLKDSLTAGKNQCYKNVSNLINSNLSLDHDWQQFRKHFEEVHSSFFKRLTGKYLEFTSNELRLCAYLRINLSSKEIAQMMNVSSDSIVKSRYRLRKKFSLQHNADLTEFIQAL